MADRVCVKQRRWDFIALHWLIAGSLAILGVTGYYIHYPPGSGTGGASMFTAAASIKWIHFGFAAALVISVAIRVALSFFSHFDADWRDIGPSMRNIKALPEALSYYLFRRKDHRYWKKLNPVTTAVIVPIWLICFAVAVLTGLALVNNQSSLGFVNMSSLPGWVFTLFGGEANVRNIHFYQIWVFGGTGAVSVYFSILRTAAERDRTFRSIISGRRLVPKKYAPIRGASGQKKRRDL